MVAWAKNSWQDMAGWRGWKAKGQWPGRKKRAQTTKQKPEK
jgi:hypothetical protein